MEGIKAIHWGKENEPLALAHLEREFSVKVSPTGLWLDNCGFIGASPDGLVGSDSIVEAKCPYKFRDISLLEYLKTERSYIIYEEQGQHMINKNHDYYHQIQGQLHITKRTQCYLVLWTPIDKIICIVPKDEEWVVNIDILKNFFLTQFIEHLLNQ
ncbi:YqaJ-like viral recombinase domain [Popillia japonica]|uniref:YqaJ-like viral recombinase domain n=1 Tax=Popillia japonica TaxID=7064 RepID=A0AAW1L490_POPJA